MAPTHRPTLFITHQARRWKYSALTCRHTYINLFFFVVACCWREKCLFSGVIRSQEPSPFSFHHRFILLYVLSAKRANSCLLIVGCSTGETHGDFITRETTSKKKGRPEAVHFRCLKSCWGAFGLTPRRAGLFLIGSADSHLWSDCQRFYFFCLLLFHTSLVATRPV